MKKKVSLFLTALCCAVGAVSASEVDSVQVAEVYGNVTACKQHTDNDEYTRFRVGGYGEVVASFKDYGINRYYGNPNGNTRDHRNTISIPRFVLAMDYKFTPKWILSAEIEFEAGGTGSAMELENSENGEYETEMEKGGEVALEQFHITRLIHPAFNVRAGHMIVPVGLTNAHHEPINFFGTVRPEGETTILPSTWHETGIEFFGTLGKGYATFDYQVLVVAGLNANGFDRNTWVVIVQGKDDNVESQGAEDLRSQLEKIGFNVEVELYDRATVMEKRSQKEGWAIHLAYFSVWNADPQVWSAWVGTNGWITNWDDENSKKMDEIFAKMLVELDQDARYKLVQDWYNTFWEYVPYVKTIDYSRMNATNAKLQGYANYCQPFFWNTWVEE